MLILPTQNIYIFRYYNMESQSLVLFFIVGAVLVGGAILFSTLVPPSSYTPAKFEPYECGIETIGGSWMQYNVGYYLFAILFLIFDVETVFLFPWATVMRETGVTAFLDLAFFMAGRKMHLNGNNKEKTGY